MVQDEKVCGGRSFFCLPCFFFFGVGGGGGGELFFWKVLGFVLFNLICVCFFLFLFLFLFVCLFVWFCFVLFCLVILDPKKSQGRGFIIRFVGDQNIFWPSLYVACRKSKIMLLDVFD